MYQSSTGILDVLLVGAGSLINRILRSWTVALYAQSLIFLLMMFDVFAVLYYNQG